MDAYGQPAYEVWTSEWEQDDQIVIVGERVPMHWTRVEKL